MRASVSVSLPKKLTNEINKITKESHVTRSELVRTALEEYLFKLRFRKTRERLIIKARNKGMFTDDDVLGRLK